MKKIIIILLMFVANLVSAQSANLTPAAIISVTNSVGSDPYTITVVLNDQLSRFTLADFSVGDSVYLLDGSDLLVYAITAKSGNQLVIDDVNNTGISAPTGQGAIVKPTSNYKYPAYIVGLRDDLRSAMLNRQIQLIDKDIKNADEIVDYIGILGVPPGVSSTGLTNATWRNTAGELYRPDGSGGWVSGGTNFINAVDNTDNVNLVVDAGLLTAEVRNSSLDSTKVKPNGISLNNIAGASGIVDGDILRWNEASATFDIDRYLRSYGNGYFDLTDLSGSGMYWGIDATNQNFYSYYNNASGNSSFYTDGTWTASIRKTQLGLNQVNTSFFAELSGDTTAMVTTRSGGTNYRVLQFRTANTLSAQPSYIENLYKPAGTIYSHKLFFPDHTSNRNWFMPKYDGELVAASRIDLPSNGEALLWNSTTQTYEPNPVIDTASIDVVRDSALMRAYAGNAQIIIMEDKDRGGMFKICVTCTADQYMVFTDALSRKWERTHYDKIYAKWFKSSTTDTLNASDLQRAFNYVGQNGDEFKSRLYLTKPVRIKETVYRTEGVTLVGDSPLRGPTTHPTDSKPVDIIYVDVNDSTKVGLSTIENARAYEIAGGIENIVLYAISPCSTMLELIEPYRTNLNNVIVGPAALYANRLFDYGISVRGSVYTHANNVHVGGGKKAGILGKAGRHGIDFGGGSFLWENSSVIRSTRAVEMQWKDSLGNQQYQSFDFNNFVTENIDSIVIDSKLGFTWTNSYTENAPLVAGGTFIKLTGDISRVVVQNVSPNAGAACATGDCYVIDGGSRQTSLQNMFVNNFYGFARNMGGFDNMIASNITHLGMTDTVTSMDNAKVRVESFYRYTGGSGLKGSKNNLNQTYKIKALADNTGSTGTSNQFMRSNGNSTWSWSNILPSQLAAEGAISGQVLGFNGTTWVPQTNTISQVANQVVYGTGTGVTSKSSFYFNPTTDRLSINAGASPSAKIHAVSASEDAARFTNSLGTLGFSFNSSGNMVNIGNDAGITAGLFGGIGLNFGTLRIKAVGSRIVYETNYNEGHMFKHDATITNETLPYDVISIVDTYNPVAGSQNFTGIRFNTSVNPGAGHTGQINMLYLGPTIFSNGVANRASAFRMENIQGWGVYQTASEIDNAAYTIRNSFMAKTGIGVTNPTLRLEVSSRKARENAIMMIANDQDSTKFFVSNTSPNGSITANPGDIVFSENGRLFQKLTGVGTNTGWNHFLNIGDSNGATSNQVLTFNGTIWAPATPSVGVASIGSTIAPLTDAASINGSILRIGQAGTTAPGVVQLAGDLSGTYTSPQIAANAVGTAEIAANSVNSGHIIDGNIATNDLADGAVNSLKITDASIVNTDIALETITTNRIQNGTILFTDWSSNGATTTGQYPYWNQTTTSWELASPLISGSVVTLDYAYNNFGATPSKINVDAAESQTGGLEFEHTGATDFIIDLAGTGDFRVQDAGNNRFQVDDSGFSAFGNVATSSNQRTIINMSGTAQVTVPLRLSNNAEPVTGDGLKLPFTLGTTDVLNIEYTHSPAEAKVQVVTGGSLENYMVISPSKKETRFENSLAMEITNVTSGTTHQADGRTSFISMSGSTLLSITLPEIVTGTPGTNQVNSGYFFELVINCSNIVAINSAGSDVMAIDGSPTTDITFNNAANTWLYKRFVAIGENNWVIK